MMSDDVEKNSGPDADEPNEGNRADSEWANRVLCSDGNCIGVIGPDGRCKECGKPYQGKLPETFHSPATDRQPASAEEEIAETDPKPSYPEPVGEAAGSGTDDSDWENRILCSDGNCIGVIGPDGRCKECGRPYTPDAEDS